jgi:rare lipoprotein A
LGVNVKVTNLENSKSVMVKVNDRGPFVKGRIIDLSKSAFKKISDTSAMTSV